MERVITINVPIESLKEAKEPYDSGDYPTAIGVNAEVNRAKALLVAEGLIAEGDDLTFNLVGSEEVPMSERKRAGSVETIYREAENGKGAIDSSSVNFEIELANDLNN